jgi:hypothetical protein
MGSGEELSLDRAPCLVGFVCTFYLHARPIVKHEILAAICMKPLSDMVKPLIDLIARTPRNLKVRKWDIFGLSVL